jgi:hypothetical protein
MRKILLMTTMLMSATSLYLTERREITDQMIRERLSETDELLLQRIDRVNADFAQTQGFEAKLKDERLDFERRMIEERKAYLSELKKTDKDLRWKGWEDFRKNQDETRRKFHEGQLEARRKFRELRDEWKSEISEEVRERQRQRAEDSKTPLTPSRP